MSNSNDNISTATFIETTPEVLATAKIQDKPAVTTFTPLFNAPQEGSNKAVTVTSFVDATTTETVHVTPQVDNNGNANMIVVGGNSQYENSVKLVTTTQYVDYMVNGPTVTSYVFATITATAYAPPNVMVVPVTNVVFWTKTVTKHVTAVVGQPIMTTAPPLLTPSFAQMSLTITETTSVATTEIITTTVSAMQPTPLPIINNDCISDEDDEDDEYYEDDDDDDDNEDYDDDENTSEME
ncbi:hypothetical protein H4S08_003657, partial [Coemansia sp. RSA 1365]